MFIDKGNGDYLKLKGEAELVGGIDKSGKTTLTGKYEFSDGAYEMNFNGIKRKFDIQKGSYITWNGEPTMANLHLFLLLQTDRVYSANQQFVSNTYYLRRQTLQFLLDLRLMDLTAALPP